MPKYRSREIVDAVRWFTGTDVPGVSELKDGRAILHTSGRTFFDEVLLVSSGDWIVDYGHYKGVKSDANFRAEYEDIGG